ncbi:NAD(P)-binding protein, partial [Basidiobolus meristosporus CBS 931.73]
VLRHLLCQVTPSEIIVSVYNVEGHQDLHGQGIEARSGDFETPRSLISAFNGGDELLLVSLLIMDDEYRSVVQIGAIDAAKQAGKKHIYHTSLAYGDASEANVMKAHFATERYLRVSGLSYTVILECCYTDSDPVYLGFFEPSSNEVAVPRDVPVSYADREELGGTTAKTIAGGKYKNQIVTLTGSKAYTLQETTDLVSSCLKKPIAFRKVNDSEWVQRHADKAYAEWRLSSFRSMEGGDCTQVHPDLEELLGRPRQIDVLQGILF